MSHESAQTEAAIEDMIHHNLAIVEASRISPVAVTAVEQMHRAGVPYRAAVDFLIEKPWEEPKHA